MDDKEYIQVLDKYGLSAQDGTLIAARIARGDYMGGIILGEMKGENYHMEFEAQARQRAKQKQDAKRDSTTLSDIINIIN